MSTEPTTIPLSEAVSIVSPIVLGLVFAVIALWRRLNDWQDKWSREVKRGVELADETPPPREATPTRPPPPDWNESTEIRRLREELELEATAELARRRQRERLEHEAAEEVLRRERERQEHDAALARYLAGGDTPPRLKRP